MMPPDEADRFGFDWPRVYATNKDGKLEARGCHLQVVRTSEIEWKGRTYRYLTVRTPTAELELRFAPGGSIRVFKGGSGGRELK